MSSEFRVKSSELRVNSPREAGESRTHCFTDSLKIREPETLDLDYFVIFVYLQTN
jgi:hypothetical protein